MSTGHPATVRPPCSRARSHCALWAHVFAHRCLWQHPPTAALQREHWHQRCSSVMGRDVGSSQDRRVHPPASHPLQHAHPLPSFPAQLLAQHLGTSPLPPQLMQRQQEGRTPIRQSTLDLISCILGASAVGYPYCFKSCGACAQHIRGNSIRGYEGHAWAAWTVGPRVCAECSGQQQDGRVRCAVHAVGCAFGQVAACSSLCASCPRPKHTPCCCRHAARVGGAPRVAGHLASHQHSTNQLFRGLPTPTWSHPITGMLLASVVLVLPLAASGFSCTQQITNSEACLPQPAHIP